MTEELKAKLTERFNELNDKADCDETNQHLYDALLKAYLAGGEYGYELGIIDKDSLATAYKAGYKNAVDKACEWLRNNLEYYLGDYNLAEDELEDNQVHYAAMLEELRKAMEE